MDPEAPRDHVPRISLPTGAIEDHNVSKSGYNITSNNSEIDKSSYELVSMVSPKTHKAAIH